jgi:hypothetical protein
VLQEASVPNLVLATTTLAYLVQACLVVLEWKRKPEAFLVPVFNPVRKTAAYSRQP